MLVVLRQSVSPLVVVSPALPPEQDKDAPEAVADPHLGNLLHPLPDYRTVAGPGPVVPARAVAQHHLTGPSNRDPVVFC